MKQQILTRLGPIRALHERWQKCPQWLQQFSLNVLIGMAIVVWIQMNPESSMVKAQQNRGLDWLSRLVTNTSLAPQPHQPLFMIEVDEATYMQWGEPWLTPADKIADMLVRLIPARPAQIIVDFDLSRREDLAPLIKVLSEYARDEDRQTQLVFMKTQSLVGNSSHVIPSFRESSLDALIAASDELHWAAPLFRPDKDGVIRNWQLIVGGCREGELELLPSVQLLSVLLEYGREAVALSDQLIRGSQTDCQQTPHFDGEIPLGQNKVIAFAGSDLRHRIIYALPPAPQDGYLSIEWKGVSLPALTSISAKALLASSTPPTAGLLDGSIVIIGATHPDSGDIHQTPLGAMTGALILANSIVALQGLDQVERPPLWLILLIEFVLVLGTSWLFLKMSPYTATMVSAALIIVVVVPLSLLAFSQGVWLDFALPVLAVQLRSVYFKASDRFGRLRRQGVKGLL